MSSNLVVHAQNLGYSFTGDPEFKLPERPRFIKEVLVVPYGQQGLLFEGVRGLQVISGRSARGFIPELIACLDGHHTIPMLHARFSRMRPDAIRDAVVLLYTRGLLEDGAPDEPAPELADLAAFAGRYNDVTRINASRGEVLARLAVSRVAVVGNDLGRTVAIGLTGQNLARLELLSDPSQLTPDSFDLLVAVFTGDTTDEARRWFAAAHALGLRALHAHVGEDKVEMGPYLIPGASGCYDCLRQLQAPPQGAAAKDGAFWSGVTALHVGHLIARLGPTKLFNNVHVHTRGPQGPAYAKHVVSRLPGCAACGLQGAGPEPDHPHTRAWVLHHAAHVMTCKELRSPRDHQIHYAASNMELTRQPKHPRYGVTQVELPALTPLNLAPPWSGPAAPHRSRVDFSLLGQLLHYAAGYQDTPDGPRRVAASGGGLGSIDLYVIARRVDGLAPGAYHYFGYGHSLERICTVEDGLLAGALGIAESALPPLLVVGVSDMRKTRQKYDEFSFRIGVIDSGVSRQVLQDVADAAGIEVVEYAGMRDKVAAHLLQLTVAGNRSMLTFAVGLGDVWIDGEPPYALNHHSQSPDALIEMCSTLGPHEPRPAPPGAPRVAPHPLRSLGELMLARRSHRRFAQRPLPLRVLRSMAAVATDADARRSHSGGLALSMKLWLVVTRGSDEIAAGAYRWDADREELVQVREGISRDDILMTMQQHGYAEAPLTCFVTGDLEAAMREFGPRGYREINSRAGSMLARVQVAAMCWDSYGSVWGGMADEGVGQVLGIDRYRDCPVFAASFGYAVDD